MTIKKGDILEVKWIDAVSSGDWTTKKEMIRGLRRVWMTTSLGYFLKRNRKGITIIQTRSKHNRLVTGGFFIPAGMVVRVRKLR